MQLNFNSIYSNKFKDKEVYIKSTISEITEKGTLNELYTNYNSFKVHDISYDKDYLRIHGVGSDKIYINFNNILESNIDTNSLEIVSVTDKFRHDFVMRIK